MKKKLLSIFFAVLSLMLFSDEKGNEIAKKHFVLKKENDSYYVASMILVDKSGNESKRKVIMYSKKTKEGTNTFIEFLEPADVKGTKFLTIGRDSGEDEQRLYLPSLGKDRRISGAGKKGEFMGSDLNYYDLGNRSINDSTYKYIKDEVYNGMNCFVLEVKPAEKDAPYSKSLIWINQNDYFMYKTECYDDIKGELIKTIEIQEVKTIDNVLIASKIFVKNAKSGKKTILIMNDLRINKGIKDDIFSVQNLKK